MKPKEREVTERIRGALKGQPIGEVLRQLNDGAPYISENEIVIAVSKLNANLYLGDLREFITALKNATGAQDRIPMAETL
jgi:hypothetical protein